MSIRIDTKTLHSGGTGGGGDDFSDKIVKYIPGDIIVAWMAASSAIKAAADVPATLLLWGAFVFLLVVTGVWKMRKSRLPLQAAISTGAFAVWVLALGGPVPDLMNPLYGTLLLIGYTVVTAAINPD